MLYIHMYVFFASVASPECLLFLFSLIVTLVHIQMTCFSLFKIYIKEFICVALQFVG